MGILYHLRFTVFWRMLCLVLYEHFSNFMGWRRRVTSAKNLNGQVVVVTGGNAGIGKETAYQLTLRGAKVYIGCRDQKKGEAAVKDILSLNPKANIKLFSLDLSSLKSVRKCVEELSSLKTKVDILINNAGVMGCPEWKTEDGFEMQFGTNHLGHFLFTLHLIPLLKKAPAGRIVTVSSALHMCSPIHLDNVNLRNGTYNNFFAYAQSKLANVLFSRELAKRLRHSNINTYSLHPGVINTELDRHVGAFDAGNPSDRGWFRRNFCISPLLGSQTTLYCALDDEVADQTGYYYNNCRRVDHMIPEANDDKTAKSLWDLSCDLVYILCRDLKKGEAAVNDILSLNPKANIKLLSLDLSSLTSVRKCVEELSGLETKVDILINNAGVALCPEWTTADGFEMQFGTNHLGHFLFTLHLIPMLKKAPAARIITVSSGIHLFGQIHLDNVNLRNGAYNPFFSYAQSKLANVLFSRELAKRLRYSNISTYSLTPGVVNTDLSRHVGTSEAREGSVSTESGCLKRRFFLSPLMGSQTTLYCALDDKLANESGFYYNNCRRVDHMIPEANDDKTAKSLWELSCDLVYIGCRDQKKGEAAVEDILALNPKANIKLLSLDLSSLKSVRKCVEELSGLETKVEILINNAELSGLETKVDILINNAGIAGCPEWQTEDGFEMVIGTNHLGHFLFTLHLIPLLKKAPAGRIVTVSSAIHKFGEIHLDNINLRNGTHNIIFAYGQSKLANVLFSRELAKRLRHSNINTYSLNPGVINTELSRHINKSETPTTRGWFGRNFLLTPFLGSQTTLYCALDDDIADETGYYYDNCRRVDHMIPEANDDKTAKSLWELSCDLRLNGQVVVITGANTGIGKETAFQLTLREAKVYILCRDSRKGENAMREMLALNPKANIRLLSLDLSSLKSVRKCVEELSDLETKVDILINNAGVMACPEWQTEDGFEMQFGTNHLGHFLLTMHLLPLLRSSPSARIINVSSSMHLLGEINLDNINLQHGAYDPTKAYAQSKLANVLFTRELAKRLDKTNVNTYSLNPGAISTDLQRHTTFSDGFFKRNFFLKPCLGSQTTLYCALDESVANESGFYYESVIIEINCHRVDSMVAEAMDDSTARKLWSLSVDLVKLEERFRI
ncbi:unnamed protein product, partial [Medioppia subpectinata]